MTVATASEKSASRPLKWHGGKTYLAPWILSHFPDHVHYVETHFGGGAVFFAKPLQMIEGHSEVVNDVHGELMNFWAVLAEVNEFQEFHRIVTAMPLSVDLFEVSRILYSGNAERALAFFVRYRQSRQGLGKDFATLSKNRTRRGMNEQVSSWLSAIDGLPEAHSRLIRVAVLNYDAVKVIKREDSSNTLFYCDPPYLHATRVTTDDYEHEMTEDDHRELLETLSGIQGRFILSGYHSPLYDDFAKRCGWRLAEKVIDNKASSKKVKDTRVECLWMNFC
jgi:DNA adenine methylase